MTARKPVRLSLEALVRVAGLWPADQNIYEFKRQLSKAVHEYRRFDSLRGIKAQKARLKKIHKTASKLADLLRTDEEKGILDWYSLWPKDSTPPSKVAEDIQRMAKESGVLETSPQKIIREIKNDNAVFGAPLEWLVGTKLPEVFEHFFGKVSLYQQGRYVQFALRVLTEFDIEKPAPSTIVTSIRDARTGRRKRTKRDNVQK
jgi:hypothetical protein